MANSGLGCYARVVDGKVELRFVLPTTTESTLVEQLQPLAQDRNLDQGLQLCPISVLSWILKRVLVEDGGALDLDASALEVRLTLSLTRHGGAWSMLTMTMPTESR